MEMVLKSEYTKENIIYINLTEVSFVNLNLAELIFKSR